MKNIEVVRAWGNGHNGHTMNLRSDGTNLYSYALLIGYTSNGKKIVKDYTKESSYSSTTSRHVNMAKKVSDVIESVK